LKGLAETSGETGRGCLFASVLRARASLYPEEPIEAMQYWEDVKRGRRHREYERMVVPHSEVWRSLQIFEEFGIEIKRIEINDIAQELYGKVPEDFHNPNTVFYELPSGSSFSPDRTSPYTVIVNDPEDNEVSHIITYDGSEEAVAEMDTYLNERRWEVIALLEYQRASAYTSGNTDDLVKGAVVFVGGNEGMASEPKAA
ncbi:MAG TPA: hypothetical protein VK338_00625, partial [Candidatus Nitrosocosmicus sp.]|nr:hypothetical protein [Candidatus Nitrosocosmicus sp.]